MHREDGLMTRERVASGVGYAGVEAHYPSLEPEDIDQALAYAA